VRFLFTVEDDRAIKTDNILVGTASWSDPGFVERWYPKGIRAADRLPWYAEHFEIVEVNSTFYSVPDPRMVERWCRATPDHFIFDVKLHRLLSRHSTPLKMLPQNLQSRADTDSKGKVKLTSEIEELVTDSLIESVEPLRSAGKLGALLLQLSPAFSPKKNRLAELDALLDRVGEYSTAVEFRNRNWVIGDQLTKTVAYLRKHHATMVSVDAPAQAHFTIMPSELDEITNPRLAYLRLHGRDPKAYLTGRTVGERFHYDYSDEEIGELAERSKKLGHQAAKVHMIFNNNALDFAPHAALRLRAALRQIATAPARQPELW
jgi:uncharacterized protein YecE (DUF72 family)